jgi:predicted membrane protein
MDKDALLICETKAGLFPDEFTVTITTKTSGQVSFFCPTYFVENNKVQITVLEESTNELLIRIPAESPIGTVFVVTRDQVRFKQPA